MSQSDVSAVTSHFATPNEGFTTTTSGTVSSGATSVGLNSVSGLTNGAIFVGVIEPSGTKEQVFTGTVDTSGSQITGVKWTKGTNVQHAAGVSVVDYDTGTLIKMLVKGLLVSFDQDGTLKAGAVDGAGVLGSSVVTTAKIADDAVTTSKIDDDAVTTAKILDDNVTPAKISGRHYQTDNNNSIADVTNASLKFQSGWGQRIGDDTATITESVVFPEAFTTVLGVLVGFLDFKIGAATSITDLTTSLVGGGGATITAGDITTSGFRMQMSRSVGTFGATAYHGYSWIAWGI